MTHHLDRRVRRLSWLSILWAALTLGSAACNHSSPTELGCVLCGVGKPQASATIDLKSSGASPSIVTVLPGAPVTFHNRDNVSHQVDSAGTTPCPELSGPVLAPGGSFRAVMAIKFETCRFVDRLNPSDTKFSGTIGVSN
jgi:plastocyanin